MEATVDPLSPGSRLDADHPENGVLIPRRFTGFERRFGNAPPKGAFADADTLARAIPDAVARLNHERQPKSSPILIGVLSKGLCDHAMSAAADTASSAVRQKRKQLHLTA